jgi:hypothetical protein
VTLPGIGAMGAHDHTRRLRRMLVKDRAKMLFATVSRLQRCRAARANRPLILVVVDAMPLPGGQQVADVVGSGGWEATSVMVMPLLVYSWFVGVPAQSPEQDFGFVDGELDDERRCISAVASRRVLLKRVVIPILFVAHATCA